MYHPSIQCPHNSKWQVEQQQLALEARNKRELGVPQTVTTEEKNATKNCEEWALKPSPPPFCDENFACNNLLVANCPDEFHNFRAGVMPSTIMSILRLIQGLVACAEHNNNPIWEDGPNTVDEWTGRSIDFPFSDLITRRRDRLVLLAYPRARCL